MLNLSMPKRTIVQCGLAALTSVLLMSWLRIRPLGIGFLLLFGFWFYKTRCNLRIVPPPELKKKYEQMAERLRDLRQNKPTMFCAVSSGCLGALAIIGHLISGSTVVLVGLVLAAIVSTKYNFKLVKIEHKDFAWSDKLLHDVVAELDDEFMPEVNETNLFVLQRASDLASISSRSPTEDAEDDDEEKSDEIPSELLIPDSIPEIDENSTDEDDLVPIVRHHHGKEIFVAAAPPSSTSAASSSADVMAFKKGHFKRDSSLSTTSSSSEESLSKGLHFPDHTAVDGPAKRQILAAPPNNQEAGGDLVALAVKSQTQALLANSGKLLPSLVSGLVQWGLGAAATNSSGGSGEEISSSGAATSSQVQRRIVTALDSSDESDFEILENEDFK